jgi:putative oxidoreductase
MIGPGLLVLRLALATVLVAHGCHELFGLFSGSGAGPGGLTQTATHFASIGLSPGLFFAVVIGLSRLAGGVLIGVGYFTRWVSLALAVFEGLEIWKDFARWGLFLNWALDPSRGHGMEYAIVTIAALVCLTLAGSGEWSIDGVRARSAASRAAGRARLRDRV